MSVFQTVTRKLWIVVAGLVLVGCTRPGDRPAGSKGATGGAATAKVVEVTPDQTPPGMKQALEKVWQQWETGRLRTGEFPPSELRTAWAGFAEVPAAVKDEQVPTWTKVRLNTAGAGFDAIRFYNPHGVSVGLIWAFAVADDPRMGWNISYGYPTVQPRGFADYHIQHDVTLAGLDLPEHNTVVFQQLDADVIAPNAEVAIWFGFDHSQPIDVYVKLRLFKADPTKKKHPHFTKAEELAEHLGFELPLRSTAVAGAAKPGDTASAANVTPDDVPPNMKIALEEALKLRFRGMGSWPEFSETLASVSSGFAQIPAAVDGKPAPWVKVRLNRLGVGLDAVRFTNTSDYPADLLWAFTFPSKVRGNWYIVPEEGSLRGFSDFHRKQNLQLAGLDLPDQNIVIFQQLGGGQLLPGGRYILWFDFESGLPVDLHVKLHLVKPDPDKYPHFRSAHPIAKSLGLELPLRFTPAAPLADRADDLAQQGSFEAALTLVDAEVAKGGNRDADFLHARLQQDYAMALGQQAAEREKAHALFLKSAESMRALQGKYGQLTAPETQFLQTAMYNEACSWALAGQAEKALNSLREAIKAGFRDAGHLLADEDLRAVRELPAFEEIMRQMDEPP